MVLQEDDVALKNRAKFLRVGAAFSTFLMTSAKEVQPLTMSAQNSRAGRSFSSHTLGTLKCSGQSRIECFGINKASHQRGSNCLLFTAMVFKRFLSA